MDDSSFGALTLKDSINMTESTASISVITERSIPVFCLLVVVSLTTVTLNALIIIAFQVEKKLRTYSNQYILNITISDLLVGFIMAIRSTIALYGKWIFPEAIWRVFIGVQNSLLGVSVLGIIVICFDRYVAIFYPLEHFKRKKKRMAHFANGLTWAVSVAFWIPIATIWDLVQPTNPKFDDGDIEPNYVSNLPTSVAIAL